MRGIIEEGLLMSEKLLESINGNFIMYEGGTIKIQNAEIEEGK